MGTVLVVDADAELRRAICTIFARVGVRTREAETGVEALPRRAGVARHVAGRAAVRARAGPHVAPVHREHPGDIRVAGMDHHRKADVADRLVHVLADAHPLVGRTIETIDPAMVLLIQPIRITGAQSDTVWIMKRYRGGVKPFDDLKSFDQREKGFASVHRFVNPAAG